ncbi:hypothetical protein CBY_3331 [Clostridium butyricum 5521]|uniref:Uncharacterized protein n=1 Tax=Clostridium butyricum E4 str. BoNT E BL5262 TaxID=632245 RepID=C4IKW0_CLOBU|nr:hypothetical protein CBY_3331 [Clostridium butyricum 5521]EEP54740.1 hypothetical protein CLP_1342 [Clostridium butyricum E4 str. BoNT E BL5262]KIU08540.1 hypothetical protein SC08_Contig83orf02539 [Clostridium butyricum]
MMNDSAYFNIKMKNKLIFFVDVELRFNDRLKKGFNII